MSIINVMIRYLLQGILQIRIYLWPVIVQIEWRIVPILYILMTVCSCVIISLQTLRTLPPLPHHRHQDPCVCLPSQFPLLLHPSHCHPLIVLDHFLHHLHHPHLRLSCQGHSSLCKYASRAVSTLGYRWLTYSQNLSELPFLPNKSWALVAKRRGDQTGGRAKRDLQDVNSWCWS